VWVDCDVIFEADDWAERTSLLLNRFMLVQPFSHLHRMAPGWEPGHDQGPEIELRRSVPFLIKSGMSETICVGSPPEQIQSAPGYAWAAHSEFLKEHSLYDACIIGGGDRAMNCAAYGCFEDAMRIHYMNDRQREHYLTWAKPFHEKVCAQVAFIEGDLFHLWHGNTEHRRYRERKEGVAHFQFDPFEDVAIDHNGSWRWNSGKHEMHEYVRNYFASRREDG
jgi:hypothetical protein